LSATEEHENSQKDINNISSVNVSGFRGKLTTPYIEPHNTSAWAQYTIRSESRDVLQEKLNTAGIPTAIHYPIPLNKQPAVADVNATLPIGDKVAEEVMSLPMHPYLNEDSILEITRALLEGAIL
jgi:UDP-2-acetamido-2-deoxy-ribo-hexuluronate aminotransferase